MAGSYGRDARDAAIVVLERKQKVHALFGFLAVVFAAVLIRGHAGAETTSGRLVVDVVFGLLLVATVGGWLWFLRNPARLEISPGAIRFSHRGRSGPIQLLRGAGDLYVYTASAGKGNIRYLMITGSEDGVPLQFFDWPEVQQACVANGWRFAGPGR